MRDQSKGVSVLMALFGATPIALIITAIVLELFVYINGGAAPDPLQIFQSAFAGFSFGLAAFVMLYNLRKPAL